MKGIKHMAVVTLTAAGLAIALLVPLTAYAGESVPLQQNETELQTEGKEDPTGDPIEDGWHQMTVGGKTCWKYYINGEVDPGKTGLQQINGQYYFLDVDGMPLTGFQKQGNVEYYFNKEGIRQNYTGWKIVEGRLCFFNGQYQISAGSGTGWKKVDGVWFYLQSGTVKTGWIKWNGAWYYLNPGTGAMKTGWYKVGTKWYFSDGSGAMLYGGWKKLGGKWYYLGGANDGAMQTGWIKTGGKWYYLGGADDGAMRTGWYKVGSKWYFSDGSGAMLYGGWKKLGGKWYYLGGANDGAMQTGWIKTGGKWYYLGGAADGVMKTGWVYVGNKWYYLNSGGVMQTGWLRFGGKWYYLNGGGVMQTGWLKVGGKWYYLNSGGIMQTGWLKVSGKWYYLNSGGIMQAGWLKVGGKWYYLGGANDGVMRSGWLKIGGIWYYLGGADDGAMKTGWLYLGGTWYYLDGSGAMRTGVQYVGGKPYMLSGSGALVTNADVILNGKSYHVDANGVIENYMSQAGQYAKQVLDLVGWNLRAAFNWSAGLTYSNRSLRAPAGQIHSEYYAVYGFENRTGNCYVMASTFCQMARLLGYEAYLVEGYVPLRSGGTNPHGWCEVVIGGTTYVFDPNFTNETGRNGYQITYGTSGTWRYSNYKRVD